MNKTQASTLVGTCVFIYMILIFYDFIPKNLDVRNFDVRELNSIFFDERDFQ